MNAPLRTPAPIGSPDELRAFILDCADLAAEYLTVIDAMARAGDDPAVARAARKLAAVTIAMGETALDLGRRQC